MVTVCGGLFEVAAVAGDAGNSEEAGFLVHKVAHLFGGETLFVHNVGYDGGVDAAAAGSHYETVKGSKTHGGVNDLAVFNGGKAGAVAEVADDELGALGVLAGDFKISLGDEAVGSAVEAVAADGVFLIILVRNAEHIGFLGHGLMEGGVENGDHGGLFSENFLAGFHGDSLGRVVERTKVAEFNADVLDKLVVNSGGRFVFLGTVEHAVTDGFDFADVLDDFVFAGGEKFNKLLESLFVGGEAYVVFLFVAGSGFVADSAVDADSFAKTFCDNFFVIHLDELVFKGRAARVDNKYFHS